MLTLLPSLIVHLDDRPDTYFPHPLLAPPIVLTDAPPSQANHIHHRTIKLYIRTLSTNEEHPLTNRPVFAIPVPQHVLLASISMQIVNSVVGLFITNGFWQPRLVAWNWKSGQMLFVSCRVLDLCSPALALPLPLPCLTF